MGVLRHAFLMFNLTRKLSIVENIPKEGEVTINIAIQNPSEIIKFKDQDVLLVVSTSNLRIGKEIAEVLLRGETLYRFDNPKEKDDVETSLKKEGKLPKNVEMKLMNEIGVRAILAVVKSSYELGIPPPVPLPMFGPTKS